MHLFHKWEETDELQPLTHKWGGKAFMETLEKVRECKRCPRRQFYDSFQDKWNDYKPKGIEFDTFRRIGKTMMTNKRYSKEHIQTLLDTADTSTPWGNQWVDILRQLVADKQKLLNVVALCSIYLVPAANRFSGEENGENKLLELIRQVCDEVNDD